MNSRLTRHGVQIPINSLTIDERNKVKSDLTVSPLHTEYILKPVSYKIYSESKNNLYVPRFYKSFHKLVSLPPFAKIDVKFAGNLKESTCQISASKAVLDKLASDTGCLLSLPTGYGKTTVALHVISALGMKTLIVVHKEFLMNQWVDKIQQFLPNARVGKIQGSVMDVENKDVVVGMLQSLSSREYPGHVFADFGLTVIDETHHICARTFSRIFTKFNTAYVLGLSATLERKDGLTHVIHHFLGDVAFFTERKNQTKVVVKTVKIAHDIPFPTNALGKVNMSEAVTMLTSMTGRNTMLLSVLEEMDPGRKILVLSDRREHCKWLCDYLEKNNKNAGLYIGGMKAEELYQSEQKTIIIGTYALAHEGLDIPTLDCVVLATPKSNINQAVGRILRETPGKRFDPLIVDLMDIWGPFISQYQQRKRYYVETGFTLGEGNSNSSYVFQQDA